MGRVISDTHALTNNGTRSYLPSYINEPMLNQSPPKPRNNPRYSFSRQPSNYIEDVSNAPFDFLPSVNFDDFHASINPNSDLFSNDVSTAPTVTAPTDVRPRMLGQAGRAASSRNTSICTSSLTSSKPEDKAEDSAVSPSRSLVRRLSNARRQPSQGSTGSANMPPPNQPSAPRGRRQSTLPTSTAKDTTPNANISRPPRKSIGPGTLTANYNGRSSVDSGASNPSYTTQSALNRTTSINRQRGSTLQQPKTTQPEAPKLATSARAAKAKSMQPTSEQAQQARQFLTSITPINTTSPSLPAAKSPGRSPGRNVGTPTSGKRQSVHVGGLGARTISPTDARRLKRLSQMQSSTPAPQTPPTPQPDFPQGIRLPLHPPPPPAMPSRKSVTPSSARGTPDAGRKQSLSTQPLSQSSSHSSLRGAQPPPMPSMPMPAPARNSQILSSSRLPTAKPRNVHSSAGFVEEEVPPVPAIPKAYESPKEQIETPFFSDHYPVPPNAGLPSSSGHRSRLADPEDPHAGAYTEPPPLSAAFSRPSPRPSLEVKPVETGSGTERQYAPGQNPRHRRGMTVGTGETDKAAAVPNAKRTTLQPVRLPPLNLLPLSTPTSNRIAAFPAPSLEVDRRAGTPPKRINTKTPSTPMTASKATFTRSLRDEDEYAAFNLRSASSFNFKPDASMYHPTDMSPELVMPPPNARTTPFSSGSLPKESGDFHYYMSQAQEHTEEPLSSASETAPELGSMISPRTQVPPQFQQHIEKERKPSSAHTANSTTDEPGTPSSGTSLRRKLSLGWRRSSSKASNKNSEEEAPKASKRNEMPPPKLPASAMWNGNVTSSPSPSIHSGRPSLDSRRRKSSVNTVRSSMDQGRSSGENGLHAQRPIRTTTHPPPPAYAEHAAAKKERAQSRSSSSLLTPMQRMLGNRSSMSALKARNLDTNLDKDDLAADKVMEKLVSKRKDFEAAARNVDELRKRAHPKERVSPAQALQMVNLNIFERGEIIDYREIYFCGTKDAKKHVGDLNSPSGANFGYDDDRGDYNIVMGDHLAYRYEVVDMLGKGSFGQVVRCVDHKTGGLVAVKIIRNKKRFHQQALVEVNILQKLREWVSSDPFFPHGMVESKSASSDRFKLTLETGSRQQALYDQLHAIFLLPRPFVHFDRAAWNEPLRIHQSLRVQGLPASTHSAILETNLVLTGPFKIAPRHPLRSEAGKHPTSSSIALRDQSHRLWFELL